MFHEIILIWTDLDGLSFLLLLSFWIRIIIYWDGGDNMVNYTMQRLLNDLMMYFEDEDMGNPEKELDILYKVNRQEFIQAYKILLTNGNIKMKKGLNELYEPNLKFENFVFVREI